ncbi:hypothetical protein JTE90_020696 [Oedothorax gibbosus]|uniref:NudC domain-containing protein 1 n=1 Tax=Oedothorax gibbosus TaxID=931172 RepID=A0AAV6V471_9ARAC|nr:hypothetical protein JTE90_020696 [Oedothorax gibbosus]
MSLINLKVNKQLLNLKFEGYKLSLDPIPVLKQPVVDGVQSVSLGNEDYSYLQTRMSLLHNSLSQDPWSPGCVFYVNSKHNVLWTSLGEDGRLTIPRCVWSIPMECSTSHANATLYFPAADWAVLCDGGRSLYILYTPSRAAGEPWMVYHTHNLEISTSSYLLHAIHHTFPTGQQIDSVIATVLHKSKLTDELHFPESFAFISILEWHSFVCGQDNQIWSKKRTRRLYGTTFPEYAAIDNIGGEAICVASQNEFQFYFDSEGIVHKKSAAEEKEVLPSKYTYIQTPEDISVYFRLPEHIKKGDLQVNLCSGRLEVLVQGNCVLSGDLANFIDHQSSTWILKDNKLEVTLFKAEAGLMWQELVKGNKEGEELMDPALVEEVHSRLAHLTSDSEVTPSNKMPFNLEQLEECDSTTEQLTFQRIDGNEHIETHRANLGGHQWLFCRQPNPESLPPICLRHDVDGILWQPKNVSSEGEMEHFEVEHTATFPALGYVLASKQDKKFVSSSPDSSFAVISDCSRHLYLYCQPESLQSGLELRNRKTGQSVAHIAKQFVVFLENCDRMMGLAVSNECAPVCVLSTVEAMELRKRKIGQLVAHIAKQFVVFLENCDRMMAVSNECIFALSQDILYAAIVKCG